MLYTNRRQTVTNCQKFIALGFLNILFLINISDCAPLNIEQSQSHLKQAELSLSSSSPLSPESLSRKRTLDGGKNPSDLAWQAWLLFDNAGETDWRSSSDSANMLRRITPKSIFIAPPLPSCPDGYESDGMNRCVKNIQIDQDAHINFLLQRLNAMYANLGKPMPDPKPEPPAPSSPSSLPSPSSSSLLLPQASGPFQLNIPLVLDTTKNDTININPNDKPIMSQDEDTIVTVYEVKDTKKQGLHEEKDDKIFLVENHSAKVDNRDKTTSNDEKLVPIVEFVQDTDSNITSIVNYNVPIISMSQIQNRTESIDTIKGSTINENLNDDELFNSRKPSNDSSISSTLVLVLAPSELSVSNITENMALKLNASTEQGAIMIKNDEKVSTTPENTSASTSQDIKTFFMPITSSFNNSESMDGSPDMEVTTHPSDERDITDENEETTSDYTDEDEEEHDVSKDHNGEDFDTSTESEEEILKHSEAGLSVTIPTTRLKPSFNPSNEKKNITAANVSSVVIIKDDFIRETTLLGLNTNGPVNISKDSEFDNNKTSNKPTNEERVVVVTPKSQIATKITYSPKDIIPIINSNNEENTESSTVTEKITTESWTENLEVETIIPTTTRIDEIPLTKSDNINPVVTIEEALMDDAMNRQQPSLFTTFEIISPNGGIDNKSRTNTDVSENSEMMTASSTNMAKIVFPRDELHKSSSLTPFADESHSTKYIRASTPPRLENIKNNISITSSGNNQQVYNYEALAQHHPNRHAYIIDDSQPVIKTIDDQRLESNKNWPIIRTTNEERFESNKKHNRPHFFPNNAGTSFVDPPRNYVRFPTYKRPHSRPGNVRFPSDEANSIHRSDDLKEEYNHRPLPLQSNRAPIRTVTGVSKQSSWRLPTGGRSDRQQPLTQRFRSANTNEQRQRDRSHMLKTFWTKMPLLKDPSLLDHPIYPTVAPMATLKQHNDEQLPSSRMVNFYNEMSAYDQTRTYAQQAAVAG